MPMPAAPKIYHIVHVDRLPSIVADGWLWSDATMAARTGKGTTIGMNKIKRRRLEELELNSHPGLHVGHCVPFYFCPRSIMLFLLYKNNHDELSYRGGQGPIVHLEADLRQTVEWADSQNLRWAFTLTNAGACAFEDRCDLANLGEIDWDSVQNDGWGYPGVSSTVRDGKQAEFLLECRFPLELVQRIGVHSRPVYEQVLSVFAQTAYSPKVGVASKWYYWAGRSK
jgi:hypothetical protein